MDLVTQGLQRAYPASDAGWESRVVSLHERQFGSIERPLALLQAAVALLFLAACFNVAGLMLARAMNREAEIATRLALGATRQRVVRQFVVESIMFAGSGGIIGVVLAWWVVALVRNELSRIVPALDYVAINGAAIALGALLSVISMPICGLIPAWRSVQVSLAGGSHRATTRSLRVRQALVVSQVAFAILLAVGAMVLVRSFVRLAAVNLGFNPQNTMAMDFSLPKPKYGNNQRQTAFIRDVLERVQRLPGVIHAGAVSDLPMRHNSMTFRIMREEDREVPKDKWPQAGVRWVTPDYFPAMQIALLKGRFLDEHDTATSRLAAVVNRSMAERFWPAGDPLGKNIRLEEDNRWSSIVGVVDDVKQIAIDSDEVPAVYLPYAQKSEEWLNWGTLVVSSSTPADQLVSAIRSQIYDIDKDQPLSRVARLQQYVDDEIMLPRFASAVSSGFSGLALILALIGLSAIVAFAVSQRTHEIGVRLALGAKQHHILRLVMNEAAKSALLGLGIGLLASFWLVRFLQALLYGIHTTEPFILAQVGGASVLLTLAACYIPATRATHIDLVKTLRDE